MSRILTRALDPQRRAECQMNDLLIEGRYCCDHRCEEGRSCPARTMRTVTHASLMQTVRRYPRSLSDAFPDVRAPAIEPHIAPPLAQRIALFFRRRFA